MGKNAQRQRGVNVWARLCVVQVVGSSEVTAAGDQRECGSRCSVLCRTGTTSTAAVSRTKI